MPEIESDTGEYDDGRKLGEWQSKYPRAAWIQILAELILIFFYLLTASFFLICPLIDWGEDKVRDGFQYVPVFSTYIPEQYTKWVALALAGFIGGTVFDLKWLYHSVANAKWHVDRCLWRIIVPFNSAMVSLFTGLLFASEIIPFLNGESFDNVIALLGFGFVFGYFSDNILAALQNLAKKIFGTLDD